jgi:tRNA uridine 5-carboxymethylaminomethyl modification enzyme
MGRAIDATGIMFKVLNTSRGAAVRGPRAQADKYAYAAEVQRLLAGRPIDVVAGTVEDLVIEDGRVVAVRLAPGSGIVEPARDAIARHLLGATRAEPIFPSRPAGTDAARSSVTVAAGAVVLTTGTFMRALMHTGRCTTEGGRVGESSATAIGAALRRMGFELGRLKTGTPPRLARGSIDWDGLDRQRGDAEPEPFCDLSPGALPGGRFPARPQVECRLTATCAAAHELIRANLHLAPMYSGQIEAECGPRYCPSIEDKVVRFAERSSHHVFLEPESLHTNEIYCNGISTSLPAEVQERIVHLMPGCERAQVLRFGYAVEYDMVWPHQIDATTMTKRVGGLFLAGQINCTTGYEEAAAQGLVAGLNAARLALGEDLVTFGRDEGYLGVMLDDLVTKTPREPYRMFTSRAEHRLLLRADNADERLTPRGWELHLVDEARWRAHRERVESLERLRGLFDALLVGGRSLGEWARRPEVELGHLLSHLPAEEDARRVRRVMNDVRYAGYVARQQAEVKRQRSAAAQRIPAGFAFAQVKGLRAEAVEVLTRFEPRTLGQAGRLAGVNPADVTLLAVALRRSNHPDRETGTSRLSNLL